MDCTRGPRAMRGVGCKSQQGELSRLLGTRCAGEQCDFVSIDVWTQLHRMSVYVTLRI